MRAMNLCSSQEEVSKQSTLSLEGLHRGLEVKATSAGTRLGCWRVGEEFTVISVQPRKVIFSNDRAQFSMLPGDFIRAFASGNKD